MRRIVAACIALGWSTTWSTGCGSRTTFDAIDGPPPPPECLIDSDCPTDGDRCFPVACVAGACQSGRPVDCDDGNVCTSDTCDAATGSCSHTPATLDLDGDGHRSPLPGKTPGERDSCGDDCDDRNPAALPGGQEICDGVDNDCNGVVDDGAALVASGDGVPISERPESTGGILVYPGGANYLATYSGKTSSSASMTTTAIFVAQVAPTGQRLGSSTRFTTGPADAQDARPVWTGDRFGLAWSDRRDAVGTSNYEVYFNLANIDGTKRGPDVRVTNSPGFSIGQSLAWTGNEFIVAWQDDHLIGVNQIYGQRLDVGGKLVGSAVKLAEDGGTGQTAPLVAAGRRSIGVLWMRQREGAKDLLFGTYDDQLRPLANWTEITDRMAPADAPVLVYNGSQYVIAWGDNGDNSPRQIFGTVRGESGETVVPTKALTSSPGVARFPDLLPYGDRVLLAWSDTRVLAPRIRSFEIYAKTLDSKLASLTGEERLTRSNGENLAPHPAFGPGGQVGVLYTHSAMTVDPMTMNTRLEAPQAFFTGLACLPGRGFGPGPQ